MSVRQNPTVTENHQVPYNPLPYYSYPPYEYPSSQMYNPPYGYPSPPVYNPAYMNPNMYPVPEYYDSRQYFPINDMMTTIPHLPHIVDSYYDEYYPSSSYRSDRSTRGSYKHRHRRKNRTLPENHHHHHHQHHQHHQDHSHSYRSSKTESHGTLPPINQHVFVFLYNLIKDWLVFLFAAICFN